MSSSETRSVEAMIWTSDTESVKSIAEVNTSKTISGAEVQTSFEVLDSERAIGNGNAKEVSSLKKKLHRKKNAVSREGKSHG